MYRLYVYSFFCYFQGYVFIEIVFFSCVIFVLCYIGVMYVVFGKIVWVMMVSFGIFVFEFLFVVGNIFIG